jgi:hypothetical protein
VSVCVLSFILFESQQCSHVHARSIISCDLNIASFHSLILFKRYRTMAWAPAPLPACAPLRTRTVSSCAFY